MNVSKFNLARHRLSGFLLRRAALLAATNGAGFLAHPTAPETFDGILTEHAMWRQGYPFRVSPNNCENIIYTSAAANHAFRFWHDVLHARHGHDLSFQGEMAVAERHLACVRDEFGSDSDEVKLMEVDTKGQLLYYHNHGQHVANQLQFAKDLLVLVRNPTLDSGITFTTCPMGGLDGACGYAVQRNYQGTVMFLGTAADGVHLFPYLIAVEKVRVLVKMLPLVNPAHEWIERPGSRANSKKPATGLPSGCPVWARN